MARRSQGSVVAFGIAIIMVAAACSGAATPAPTKAPTAAPSPAGSAAPSPAGPALATLSPDGAKVTLRVATGFGKGSVFNGPLELLAVALSERSGGRLTLRIDGPEVVVAAEQLPAVQKRVYDINYTVPLFFSGQVPEGEALYFISGKSTCAKYREAGALEPYDQAHRTKANAFLLACGGGGAHGATFLLKAPITSLDELRGKKFRGFGLYTRVLEALGASSVAMPPTDIYGAVQRGIVDGAAYPNLGIVEQALQEVLPYMIMPPYLSFRYGFYMNVDSFKALPTDMQTYLTAVATGMEPRFDKYYADARDNEAVVLQQKGMKIVTLPQAANDRLKQLVTDGLWSYIRDRSPQFGPQIQQAFEKVEPR